jgi:hypothetical protein
MCDSLLGIVATTTGTPVEAMLRRIAIALTADIAPQANATDSRAQ